MAKDKKSIKDRLERRKLLGAMGASPLVGIKSSEVDLDDGSSVLENKDKTNTIHFVTAKLTHKGDIPGTLLGDQDSWSRYKFNGHRIILSELLTSAQRELFESSSEIIHFQYRSIESPPLSVSEAPIDVIQIEALESNSNQYIGLSDRYTPPSAIIRTGPNYSVTLEQKENENITVKENETIEVEYDEELIRADIGSAPKEFKVRPILRVNNYGKLPVYESTESYTENVAAPNQPFTIGEENSVRKMRK